MVRRGLLLGTPAIALCISAILLFGPRLDIASQAQPEKNDTPAYPVNVLLITVDTLRADHLSVYGYQRPTTPNLDDLAASGVLFTRAVTQFSQTNPSHATIMTGDYAVTHGLRWHGADKVKENVPTLAQVFQAVGYRTGAVISWPSLRVG